MPSVITCMAKNGDVYFWIRMGIGVVMLWFGVHKFIDPGFWMGYVAPFFTSMWPASLTVFFYISGIIETLIGVALLTNKYVKVMATIACFWLLAIIINVFAIGAWDIAVRDIGLLAILFTLARQ